MHECDKFLLRHIMLNSYSYLGNTHYTPVESATNILRMKLMQVSGTQIFRNNSMSCIQIRFWDDDDELAEIQVDRLLNKRFLFFYSCP